MKRILLALPLALLAACGGDNTTATDKDVLMKCDYDTLVGWLPDSNVLTKEKAHSGIYSVKVDANREFSLGYSSLLGQLSSTRIKGVHVDGWAFLTDKNSTASISVELKDVTTGNIISRQYIEYGKLTQYGKWTPISGDFIFPANATYTSQLVIYLWRATATTPAYLDDLRISAIK